MDFRRSEFCMPDVDRYGIGGGVLPFSVDDEGHVRVLLGRERFVPSWKGSCRWSGFEGTRKDNDALLMDTALREFAEESLGVVADDVASTIARREFHMRIVVRICTDKHAERYHSTYVVSVRWDEALPKKFQARRSSIEHIDRLAQRWRTYKQLLFHDVKDVFKIERGERAIGDDGDDGDDEVVTIHTTKRVSHVDVPPPLPALSTEVEAATEATEAPVPAAAAAAATEERTQVLRGRGAKEVLEWSRLRDRLDSAIVENDHASIRATRDPKWNVLQEVDISNDYLEKDQIRWWYMHELEQVLAHHGQWCDERFRPYFLAVLQTFMIESRSGEALVHLGTARRREPAGSCA